jgi:hypothetical protein
MVGSPPDCVACRDGRHSRTRTSLAPHGTDGLSDYRGGFGFCGVLGQLGLPRSTAKAGSSAQMGREEFEGLAGRGQCGEGEHAAPRTRKTGLRQLAPRSGLSVGGPSKPLRACDRLGLSPVRHSRTRTSLAPHGTETLSDYRGGSGLRGGSVAPRHHHSTAKPGSSTQMGHAGPAGLAGPSLGADTGARGTPSSGKRSPGTRAPGTGGASSE